MATESYQWIPKAAVALAGGVNGVTKGELKVSLRNSRILRLVEGKGPSGGPVRKRTHRGKKEHGGCKSRRSERVG